MTNRPTGVAISKKSFKLHNLGGRWSFILMAAEANNITSLVMLLAPNIAPESATATAVQLLL